MKETLIVAMRCLMVSHVALTKLPRNSAWEENSTRRREAVQLDDYHTGGIVELYRKPANKEVLATIVH
eukprot:12903353-Prorocentrum_lima.AAC.1